MKLTSQEFNAWENKSITFLGMSGVGKTHLAQMLRRHHWFHYAADYRVGTRYLDEPILDNIKAQAMQIPFLRELLRTDSIYIANNITTDNLAPVSSFLGKLGNPEFGGLPFREFQRRQQLFKEAEIRAMLDVPEFIAKASAIYGYQHFVNDAGGSLCELDEPEVIELLAQHTLILYLEASQASEQQLIQRAALDPKPLYYRPGFLTEKLGEYMRERDLRYIAMINPDDFVRWVFPRLLHARLPRYQALASTYGYVVSTDELAQVYDEYDFLQLVEIILARQTG